MMNQPHRSAHLRRLFRGAATSTLEPKVPEKAVLSRLEQTMVQHVPGIATMSNQLDSGFHILQHEEERN